MSWGATVTCCVSQIVWGKFLHAMEYREDVFVVSEALSPTSDIHYVKLRSDSFPADWNGGEVLGRMCDQYPAVWFEIQGRSKRSVTVERFVMDVLWRDAKKNKLPAG